MKLLPGVSLFDFLSKKCSTLRLGPQNCNIFIIFPDFTLDIRVLGCAPKRNPAKHTRFDQLHRKITKKHKNTKTHKTHNNNKHNTHRHKTKTPDKPNTNRKQQSTRTHNTKHVT